MADTNPCGSPDELPSNFRFVAQLRAGDNDNGPFGPSEYAIGDQTWGQLSWGVNGTPGPDFLQLNSGWRTVMLELQANPATHQSISTWSVENSETGILTFTEAGHGSAG